MTKNKFNHPVPNQKLDQFLEKIKPINFNLEFNRVDNSNSRIREKHYITISIEQILKLIDSEKAGLITKDDLTYFFNGAFWEVLDQNVVKDFLSRASIKMGAPLFDAKYFDFKDKLYKQFQSSSAYLEPKLSQDKVLINLQNGTFVISPKGYSIKTFDKADFLTYQLPFVYDPDAKAPLFQKYLDRVLSEKESQMILAEYIGSVFIKNGSSFKEEKTLILFGSGANGKSVFFEIIQKLLGEENISNYSLESLTNSSGYQRSGLRGKLLNYASEISPNLDPATFKQIVSGEPIECRLPYGKPFILRNYAKLMFNCNVLPKVVENTSAYYRRFMIVPFLEKLPEEEQDKSLHNKIIENELPGVFNFVLDGLKRLIKTQKFTISPLSDQMIEQFKTESSSVKLFLEENGYSMSPSAGIFLKELYFEYKTFCLEDGHKFVNKQDFIKQLKDGNIGFTRKNQGYYVHITKKV